MTKRTTLLLALALSVAGLANLQAQDSGATDYPTPKDMLEFGIGGGYAFIAGDVTHTPSYGVGLHFRKSLDYVFSLRFDGFYGQPMGEQTISEQQVRRFETTYIAGTGFGVISANSLNWNKSVRKTNLYAMIGVGGSYFKADSQSDGRKPVDGSFPDEGEFGFSPHIAGGVGVAFRISKRMNIALEHQAFYVFGTRSDRMDGLDLGTNRFRDLLNFTALKLNFNIGNAAKASEPLYWINPLENVMSELSDIKEKQNQALNDSDGDGVPDLFDQEPNTPPGVPVDTKGRTLDSDGDGVPDYKDKEPYFPPRPGERVDEEGVVVNPISPRDGGVSEDRVREIIAEELQNYSLRPGENDGGAGGGGGGGQMAEWFLPMIHFSTDSDRLKYSDYGTLASIARMMKGNPSLRLVITGFADVSAGEAYNDVLSYKRAKSVVDHFVNTHGIGRGRMLIEWKGQNELLVPVGTSYMNRRVEFRVAQSGDVEMDPPAGYKGGNDGY